MHSVSVFENQPAIGRSIHLRRVRINQTKDSPDMSIKLRLINCTVLLEAASIYIPATEHADPQQTDWICTADPEAEDDKVILVW